MRLRDRVALVTGAQRGIGYACAERLAQEGAKVVISDISEEGGQAAKARLAEAGHDVTFIRADVSQVAEVSAMVGAAAKIHGAIDILVNNAGVVEQAADILEFPLAEFDRVLSINLRGVFMVAQAAGRLMRAQAKAGRKAGSIVNITSLNAHYVMPDHVAYSVSKHGVAALTKAMAISLAKDGIRVNAIGPGTIETGMAAAIAGNPQAMRTVLSRTPLGRLGKPAEIAAVAAFLASDDASYFTGQILYPDGGRMFLNQVVPVPGDRD